MSRPPTASPFTPVAIRLPCAESCAAYRPINGNHGWSDYGICTNRRSPLCGYPTRLGRECAYYLTDPAPELTRAT